MQTNLIKSKRLYNEQRTHVQVPKQLHRHLKKTAINHDYPSLTEFLITVINAGLRSLELPVPEEEKL